jgi:glycosyltransferase involved in cell wall biosynthesis
VGDGRTGLHFTPGDAEDLARKVEWAWNHPDEMRRMGQNARAEYAAKYKANQHYQFMMDLYQTLCGHLDVTSLTSATCEQIVQS